MTRPWLIQIMFITIKINDSAGSAQFFQWEFNLPLKSLMMGKALIE